MVTGLLMAKIQEFLIKEKKVNKVLPVNKALPELMATMHKLVKMAIEHTLPIARLNVPMDAEYIDGKDNVELYPAGSWIWSNNGKSVFALKTEAYPLTALLAGMSDVEKAVEQVSDFTLRFASLLGDATSVKANGEFTSNNVTREVILTDANFTLTDALGDTFYLFDGVKSDGNVDKRSDMNLRQGFEEGTEGFETDFTLATAGIKAYYYKNGVKQNIPVTVGAEDTNATLVTNENTKTRAWEPGSISATDVIVTDLPFSHIFVFMTTAIK